MRYYHPFPEAIPLSKAGCSRVTHPSATKLNSKLLNSVRLACVKRAASVRPEPGSNSLLNSIYQLILFNQNINPVFFITLACYYCFVFFSLFLTFLFLKRNFKGRYFFTLFNFQDAVSFCLSLICDSLFIIPLLLDLVKYFFQISLNFFRYFFRLAFATAFLLYHFLSILSSTFSNFFQNSFQ